MPVCNSPTVLEMVWNLEYILHKAVTPIDQQGKPTPPKKRNMKVTDSISHLAALVVISRFPPSTISFLCSSPSGNVSAMLAAPDKHLPALNSTIPTHGRGSAGICCSLLSYRKPRFPGEWLDLQLDEGRGNFLLGLCHPSCKWVKYGFDLVPYFTVKLLSRQLLSSLPNHVWQVGLRWSAAPFKPYSNTVSCSSVWVIMAMTEIIPDRAAITD